MTFQSQGRGLFNWLPVAFACGALAYLAPSFEPGIVAAAAAFAAALAAIGLAFFGRGAARVIGLGLVFAAAGWGDAAWSTHRRPPMPALPTRAVMTRGTVVAIETVPRERAGEDVANGRRVVLRSAVFEDAVDAGMAPLQRDLRITLRDGDTTALEIGDQLRLRVLLRPPPVPSMPGGRDPQREAWFSGLAGSGRALAAVQRLAPARQRPVMLTLARLRDTVAAQAMTVLPDQRGAIAATLLAGHSDTIARGVRQDFAAAGLSHLLAVAGLHLALVMGALIFALRGAMALWRHVAERWPTKEIAFVAALFAGGAYVVLTGMHLPAIRALGMASIGTLAVLTGRHVLSMRALALVALGILMVAPEKVLDLSFQMSFSAVMALIAGYDALRPWIARQIGRGEGYSWLAAHGLALLLTSLLAGCATLPVSVAYFGLFEPWFVLANLVAVPLAATWIMPAGLLALLLMPFGAAGLPLDAMGAGIGIILRLSHAVAALPLAQVPVPAVPGWGLAGYLAGLCMLCLWRGRFRLLGVAPIVFALASPWLVQRPDILVAPDGGAVAVNQGGSLAFGPIGSRDRLTGEDWVRAYAWPRTELTDCVDGYCRAVTKGETVLLRLPVRTGEAETATPPEICAGASLFVSALPERGACGNVPVIDRFSVWRDGTYAAYARGDGQWRIVSDRSWRGARPWVPPVGARGAPNLPLAQAE